MSAFGGKADINLTAFDPKRTSAAASVKVDDFLIKAAQIDARFRQAL
jgi:hypothetical protein